MTTVYGDTEGSVLSGTPESQRHAARLSLQRLLDRAEADLATAQASLDGHTPGGLPDFTRLSSASDVDRFNSAATTYRELLADFDAHPENLSF